MASFELVNGEVQVNTFSANNQTTPVVAALPDGGYVVVWRSANQDGSGNGIFGQRFNADGTTNGAEFRVNTTTANDQENPDIASTPTGFVVIWESFAQDGSGDAIAHRFVDIDGSGNLSFGAEIRSNEFTTNNQAQPSVAVNASGVDFAVWDTVTHVDGNRGVVVNSLLTNSRTADVELSDAVNVNSAPHITALANGNFLVSFNGTTGTEAHIISPIFTNVANGTGVGGLLQLGAANGVTAGLTNGNFVFVATNGDITVQVFDSAGSAVSAIGVANDSTGFTLGAPFVTPLQDGGFLVTWHSQNQDGSSFGIFSRRFDDAGEAVGAEFQVNTTTANAQTVPEVVQLASGEVVYVWKSEAQDGDSGGIFAQTVTLNNPVILVGDAVIDDTQIGAGLFDTYDNTNIVSVDGDLGGLTTTTDAINVGLGPNSTGFVQFSGGEDPIQILVTGDEPGDAAPINVGRSGGNGTLLISGGAQVVSTNYGYYNAEAQEVFGGYGNINIGRDSGSVGNVTVTGDGSNLSAFGLAPRLTVGRDGGNGTLTIADGADVGTLSVEIGRRGDATGLINVTGVGSRLTVNDNFGQFGSYQGNDYSGSAGTIRVGRQGADGTLSVTAGGVVNIFNTDGVTDSPRLDIARGAGSDGTVIVSGTGSRINVIQFGETDGSSPGIRVGTGGYGQLFVVDNGQVNITGDDAFLGVSDRFGYDDYTGRTSQISIQSGGVINVTGGEVAGGFVQVGQVNGQRGLMTIDGAGSELNLSSDPALSGGQGAFLTVGNRSEGILSITNGGAVNIDGGNASNPGLQLGRGEDDGSAPAQGTLLISGAGSSVTVDGTNLSGSSSSGFMAVGSRPNGEGLAFISDGGSLALNGTNSELLIGFRGAEGALGVSGAGSSVTVGGLLGVGLESPGFDLGEGILLVENGATLTAGEVRIGEGGEGDLTGNVTADITLQGGLFAIDSDGVGALNVDGDFDAGRGSGLFIDIDDLGVDAGDTLNITGDGNFLTRQMVFVIEIDENVAVTTGDQFVFATVGGTLTADTRVVFDLNRGIELTLSADGNNLVLTANEDAAGSGDIVGDGNANLLTGDGDANVISGLGGNDTLVGLGGNDSLLGGDDDDILNGGAGRDTLDGGTGSNTASFEDAPSLVRADLTNGIGGSGEAAGDVFTNIQNLIGSNFNDRLFGTDDANFINGGGGNDRVIALDGNDTIEGGLGDDTLFGLDDDDLLLGGGGVDSLSGGQNDDTLEGGADGDVLNGGGGDDTASYLGAGNKVTVDLRTGGTGTGDALGDTFVSIENIQGSGFNDRLIGNNLANGLLGEDGADRIFGLNGNDTIDGGSGNDFIAGGGNVDELTGSSGRDFFVFNSQSESGVGAGNRDIVTDFDQGANELLRMDRVDGDTGTGGNQDLFFVNGDAFSNTAGEVRFEQVSGNTIVQVDTNGDGSANMEIELTGLITLTGSDFLF